MIHGTKRQAGAVALLAGIALSFFPPAACAVAPPLPPRFPALQFAHKLAGKPWTVSDWDVCRLVDVFGRERALDLVWYCSWCNYMTRVADAF